MRVLSTQRPLSSVSDEASYATPRRDPFCRDHCDYTRSRKQRRRSRCTPAATTCACTAHPDLDVPLYLGKPPRARRRPAHAALCTTSGLRRAAPLSPAGWLHDHFAGRSRGGTARRRGTATQANHLDLRRRICGLLHQRLPTAPAVSRQGNDLRHFAQRRPARLYDLGSAARAGRLTVDHDWGTYTHTRRTCHSHAGTKLG